MCGLFGIARNDVLDEASLERARDALDTLVHRGPDGSGEYVADGVFLGHRRLSILDTSDAGRQPMVANGVAVTVNGEIYNFSALRRELEHAGCRFRSGSDSEVVLHGYQVWGLESLVMRLEGMYAVVIHDSRARRVFGFRDRIGVKPLFYHLGSGQLAWASELKAIVRYAPDKLALQPESFVDFLAYRYIPAPKTLYRDVFKLPPATILEFDVPAGRVSTRRYWSLPTQVISAPADELSGRLRDLLDVSIRDQLVSDVPLGLLLSGGLDSSAIAAFAGRRLPDIRSFSIGFNNPARDETKFAQQMSSAAGTRHAVEYLGDDDMSEFPAQMTTWFDEPFADTSAVPTYRVCEFASRHVTVALSGDGGDELFGGYKWYDRFAWATRRTRMMPIRAERGIVFPSQVPYHRELRLMSFSDPVWRYAHIRGSLPASRLDRWKSALGVAEDYDPMWAYRQHYHPELSPRRAAQVMDFHTFLPDDVLTKVDRVSMAVSLECRPPLLATGLVELAFSLPEAFVYRGGQLKGGLKQVLRRDLPASILSHGKQGFGVPQAAWMKRIIGEAGSWQEALVGPYVEGLKVPELQ
jgi:asparagine synthase (glutamine-hydrolysing)